MKNKWQGDSSLYWKHCAGDDYIQAVKVTCCNEADGPDNLWLVESGTYPVSMKGYGGKENIDSMSLDQLQGLVYALDGYYGVQQQSMNGESYVQVGAKRRGGKDGGLGSTVESDYIYIYILRGNMSLDKFIREEFLD